MVHTTATKADMLHFVQTNFPVSAHTLDLIFPISRQMIHRHLKDLCASKDIYKQGKAPKVYYYPSDPLPANQRDEDIAWTNK